LQTTKNKYDRSNKKENIKKEQIRKTNKKQYETYLKQIRNT